MTTSAIETRERNSTLHAALRLNERFRVQATNNDLKRLTHLARRAALPHLGISKNEGVYLLVDLKRWIPTAPNPRDECIAVFANDHRCIVTFITGRQFRRTFNLHLDAPLRAVPFGSSPRRGKPAGARKAAPC